MTPPIVNACYDAQMNDINFPAGVLQPPLFDVKMDAAHCIVDQYAQGQPVVRAKSCRVW